MEVGFDFSRDHIRRNIKKLRALINASARMHFLQRNIIVNDQGQRVIIASPQDLKLVLSIGERALQATFNVMSEAAIETYNICRALMERGEDITAKSVFLEIEKTKPAAEPTIYKRLQSLCHKGFLRAEQKEEQEQEEEGLKKSEKQRGKRGRPKIIYFLTGNAAVKPLSTLVAEEKMQEYEQKLSEYVKAIFCTPNLKFERTRDEKSSNLPPLTERSSNQGDPKTNSFNLEVGSTKNRGTSNDNKLAFSISNCFYDIALDDFNNSNLEENSIDLILTDPPYAKQYLYLWEELGELAKKVLKPGAFLIAYAGHLFLDEQKKALSQYLTFKWQKTVILKGPEFQILDGQEIRDRPCLILYKEPFNSEYENKRIPSVLYSDGIDKRFHPWGQAVKDFVQLASWFSKEGDLVLDPFAGGGTTIQACIETKRSCMAYEIDEKAFKKMKERFASMRCSVNS
jgi:DNA modification methylase/DNA-binding PadR family transcriptional regulator